MDFIQQNLMLVLLVVTSGSMLLFNLFAGGQGKRVTAAEATTLINREDAHVIDVRGASEFASGHLPGASNIEAAKIAERAADLEKFKGKPLIVCCETGMRSGKAASELTKLGFERVVCLEGGIAEWRKAGLPISGKGKKK